MEVRIMFESNQKGPMLQNAWDNMSDRVKEAMRGSAKDAADELLFRLGENIADAGNFGDRWQEAPQVHIEENREKITLEVSMKGDPPVSYWRVFEYGARITPRNASGLLWIPFDKEEVGGLWPRASGIDLFRGVSQKGTPLLGDKEIAKDPAAEPEEIFKYWGIEEVTIPKKFDMREIIKKVARELRDYYRERMKK